jgi:Holliday junction resolvase RusA-like endonuclease
MDRKKTPSANQEMTNTPQCPICGGSGRVKLPPAYPRFHNAYADCECVKPKAITFEVQGEPKAQPRARSFILRGKGGKPILGKNGQPILRVHEAGSAENWKSLLAEAAKPFVPMPPLQGPLRVDIEFRFSRPKAHFRSNGQLKPGAPVWHTKMPDRDNAEKAVTDALKVLGMFGDDSQVCAGEVTKRFEFSSASVPYGRPGATITITPLEQPKAENKPQKQKEMAL